LRIDLFLKKICIVKSRSAAARLCEEGKISVNGRLAKSSKAVKPEDEISIVLGPRELVFSIMALPESNVSKAQAPSFYRILSEKRLPGAFE